MADELARAIAERLGITEEELSNKLVDVSGRIVAELARQAAMTLVDENLFQRVYDNTLTPEEVRMFRVIKEMLGDEYWTAWMNGLIQFGKDPDKAALIRLLNRD